MVQAFVVIISWSKTLEFPRVAFGIGVHDVAGDEILPEGKASGNTCKVLFSGLAIDVGKVVRFVDKQVLSLRTSITAVSRCHDDDDDVVVSS